MLVCKKRPLKTAAFAVQRKAQKIENESVADHYAMSWVESTKLVNACKSKPGNGSEKRVG